MTGQDRDNHEIIEVGDLADDLRASAMQAWNVPEDAMAVVEKVADLPLAAALQGPQGSRRMFAPQADAYNFAETHETPLKYADSDRAGIDLVRCTADAPFGQLVVVDTAAFTVFSAPTGVPLRGEILNIAVSPNFHDPSANGWSTTAPDVWVQNMSEWHERIDMRDHGTARIYLLYKTFSSSRIFTPSLEWF